VYVFADQLQDVELVKGKSYQNKERFRIDDYGGVEERRGARELSLNRVVACAARI
jgi:hypothetical protein